MAFVRGPDGTVWELDDVVASGLVGGRSGDYSYAEPPAETEKSKPAKRAPKSDK